MKVVNFEISPDWFSVCIRAKKYNFWLDVSKDLNRVDWNQYIFDLTNANDLFKRRFQDKPENFDKLAGLAVEFIERLHGKVVNLPENEFNILLEYGHVVPQRQNFKVGKFYLVRSGTGSAYVFCSQNCPINLRKL